MLDANSISGEVMCIPSGFIYQSDSNIISTPSRHQTLVITSPIHSKTWMLYAKIQEHWNIFNLKSAEK